MVSSVLAVLVDLQAAFASGDDLVGPEPKRTCRTGLVSIAGWQQLKEHEGTRGYAISLLLGNRRRARLASERNIGVPAPPGASRRQDQYSDEHEPASQHDEPTTAIRQSAPPLRGS